MAGCTGGHATVVLAMIDIRLVRDDSASVKAALGRRGVDPAEIDRLIGLDEAARAVTGKRDDFRAQVKSLSRQVADARRSGDTAAADGLTARSRSLGEEERSLNAVADAAQEEVRQALLYLPNLPSDDTPDGSGPDDNLIVRTWPDTDPTYTEAQRVPHWEVGTQLGLLDMERGAKLSGSMFPLYRGFGARLLRALTSFALDCHADQFEEDPGPHRDHGVDRAPPQVRRGGVPPRARRPVGHPHRRGAPDLDVEG
jgi:seryl-tRNA synthetase